MTQEYKPQTRLVSLIEVCINTVIGFVISLIIWPFVGGIFGIEYSYERHIGITVIFTVVSVIRSYIIRRSFERRIHEVAVRWAQTLTQKGKNNER